MIVAENFYMRIHHSGREELEGDGAEGREVSRAIPSTESPS